MTNNKFWPSILGAYSSYREHESSNSDSSDTDSVLEEAPRGPSSPIRLSNSQQDAAMTSLSDALQNTRSFHSFRDIPDKAPKPSTHKVQASSQKVTAASKPED